jgi:hypothetical protein
MRKTLKRNHTAIQRVAARAVSALLLIGEASVHAGAVGQANAPSAPPHSFVTVLDSQRDGLEASRCPAINTLGTIAVTVTDTQLGGTKIITKRHANDLPAIVADTAVAGDFPTFCDNGFNNLPSDPSINENGEVAFQGNLRRVTTRTECATPAQRARRQGVFLGAGGALTTIAHSINEPGGSFISEFLVADQSVNTSGRVAIVPQLDLTFEQGLFIGSKAGTFDQRFLADTPTAEGFNFNNLSSRVSMNELGQVAFESGLNNTEVGGIFLSNPDGTFRTVVDNTGSLSEVANPSIDIFGRVAFTGSRFDNKGTQIVSINTVQLGEIITVAESRRGGYAFFSEPSLNDLGMVAFTADVQPDPKVFTTVQGVFTGADPRRDKVLQAGDLYEGVTVTSVRMCAEGLNNLGQIAMIVQSQDPDTFEVRTFVVKATPRNDD